MATDRWARIRASRGHADVHGWGPRDTLVWLLFVSGTAVGLVGERLGARRLIYNPLLFGWFHLVAVRTAPGVYAALRAVFPDARRFADVGAGSGAIAAHGTRLGLDVVACEHSPVGRLMARAQGVTSVPFDVAQPVPARLGAAADVAYCIEVAEHIPAGLADGLVRFLASAAPVVVFTAAHPGQGGQGHVNEQPAEYWIARFAAAGMAHDPDRTQALAVELRRHLHGGEWIAANALVFQRTPAPATAR